MTGDRVKFVLCWHMHQPWYREGLQGDYRLPWVYLHGIKDYADMAAHLEAHPRVRVVVNFTPVLLEQIDDYARQIDEATGSARAMSEPLLNLLAGIEPLPQDIEARGTLIRACTRAHRRNMIEANPRYRDLVDQVVDEAGAPRAHLVSYLTDQYFIDLLVWYHLAWLGRSVRVRDDVRALVDKGGDYSMDDRLALLGVIRETLAGIAPRYRELAARGQVELSMTPWAHPIAPLLIDFDAMASTQPQAPRPFEPRYPGGEARCRWHIEQGMKVFEEHFGTRPAGVWLAEGAVSDAAVALLDDYGIAWTASGEGVWANSVNQAGGVTTGAARRGLFRCHRFGGRGTKLFFRDDGLSDLIGFEYQQWDGQAAAQDFAGHVRNIVKFIDGSPGEHVISVILDGENAWEYYPDNGHHFLDALYRELADIDVIELTTFRDVAGDCQARELDSLCAGSWVHGSFSTWIGEPDKNHAWDCLVHAKERVDEVLASEPPRIADVDAVQRQLAVCEGSDWFWWFGDYNPARSVHDFESLFRRQLVELYRLLGENAPEELSVPLSSGGGDAEMGGAMRRGAEH